jgi:BASS family bile acid:Na+ symporter
MRRRWHWPGLAERAKAPVRVGSGVLLVVAIVSFLIDQRENLVNFLVQAGPVTATLCFVMMLLGYVTAKVFKLSQAARITIAVEMGLHNIPLALTLAASLLANPRFAIPPAAYGLVTVFLLALVLVMVIVWRPMPRRRQL